MIELFVQSRYRVNRNLLRKRTHAFLIKSGLKTEAYVVSIAIVGDRKMADLHKKYAQKQGTTPVLSFTYIQSGYEEKYHASRNTDEKERENATLLGEIIRSEEHTSELQSH